MASRARLVLLSLVVAAATSLMAFEVSPAGVLGPAPYDRYSVKTATSGNGSLVVWTDLRLRTRYQLRGALLDVFGQPIGEHDFKISDGEYSFDLASDGRDYLVGVWNEDESVSRFYHVSARGRVRSAAAVDGVLSSLAYAGGHYFTTIDGEIFIFDERGTLVRGNVPIGPDAWYGTIHAARDGRLLLLWRQMYGHVFGGFVRPEELFDSSFQGLHPERPLDASLWSLPASVVQWDDGFLLIWQSENFPSHRPMSVQLLTGDGYLESWTDRIRLVSEDAVVIRTENGLVSFCANCYQARMLRGSRSAGSRWWLYSESPVGPMVSSLSALPQPGGRFLLTYLREMQVYAQMFPYGEPVRLTRALPSQTEAVAARCGDTEYIAWTERSGDASIVRYRRFDAAGVPLDPDGLAIDPAPSAEQDQPSITCGKETALLTWRHLTNYERQRAGALLRSDNEPQRIDFEAGGDPLMWFDLAVAFDGADYVVAHAHTAGLSMERWSENGQRILRTAILEEPGVLGVGLAWNGSELLVAHGWQRVQALRLDPNFQPIGERIVLDEVAVDGDHFLRTVVAASDGGWLVGWEHDQWTQLRVPRAMRLNRDGEKLDSAPLRIGSAGHIDVAWNGAAYEVLTGRELTSITPGGEITTRPLLEGEAGEAEALTSSAGRRLLVFSRFDRVHDVRRLFAESVRP